VILHLAPRRQLGGKLRAQQKVGAQSVTGSKCTGKRQKHQNESAVRRPAGKHRFHTSSGVVVFLASSHSSWRKILREISACLLGRWWPPLSTHEIAPVLILHVTRRPDITRTVSKRYSIPPFLNVLSRQSLTKETSLHSLNVDTSCFRMFSRTTSRT
jgi:hypothetical protein